MPDTALVYTEAGLRHETPHGHPERPERLLAIQDAFKRAQLNPPRIEPRLATEAEILRVHTQEHIDTVRRTCETSASYADPDTYMMPASWDAALYAAGGAIEACNAVLEGRARNVFCAMRPPGHHAEADRAMGFCLFNSVAIAARWLREEAGLDRVAILDWDVHHGNGTQHSFYDDPFVYYVSVHQFPHYPGTGRPEERGAEDTNLNITMAPGTSADAWIGAIESQAVPAIESFDPEFLLISSGFDAHKDDPLGHQNLDSRHFADMTRMVRGLARGNVVSLLEGGYNLHALGESAVAHFQALQGS